MAKCRVPERDDVECEAHQEHSDADRHHAEEVEEAVERDGASKDEQLHEALRARLPIVLARKDRRSLEAAS